MDDNPSTSLKALVNSTMFDRAAYTLSGMGALSLLLSPAAAVFLWIEENTRAALLIGGLLLLWAAIVFYCAGRLRRWSQRLIDEFVTDQECPCELCQHLALTPKTTWPERSKAIDDKENE